MRRARAFCALSIASILGLAHSQDVITVTVHKTCETTTTFFPSYGWVTTNGTTVPYTFSPSSSGTSSVAANVISNGSQQSSGLPSSYTGTSTGPTPATTSGGLASTPSSSASSSVVTGPSSETLSSYQEPTSQTTGTGIIPASSVSDPSSLPPYPSGSSTQTADPQTTSPCIIATPTPLSCPASNGTTYTPAGACVGSDDTFVIVCGVSIPGAGVERLIGITDERECIASCLEDDECLAVAFDLTERACFRQTTVAFGSATSYPNLIFAFRAVRAGPNEYVSATSSSMGMTTSVLGSSTSMVGVTSSPVVPPISTSSTLPGQSSIGVISSSGPGVPSPSLSTASTATSQSVVTPSGSKSTAVGISSNPAISSSQPPVFSTVWPGSSTTSTLQTMISSVSSSPGAVTSSSSTIGLASTSGLAISSSSSSIGLASTSSLELSSTLGTTTGAPTTSSIPVYSTVFPSTPGAVSSSSTSVSSSSSVVTSTGGTSAASSSAAQSTTSIPSLDPVLTSSTSALTSVGTSSSVPISSSTSASSSSPSLIVVTTSTSSLGASSSTATTSSLGVSSSNQPTTTPVSTLSATSSTTSQTSSSSSSAPVTFTSSSSTAASTASVAPVVEPTACPAGNLTKYSDNGARDYTIYCDIDSAGAYRSARQPTFGACIRSCDQNAQCTAVSYTGDNCFFILPPVRLRASVGSRLAMIGEPAAPPAGTSSSSVSSDNPTPPMVTPPGSSETALPEPEACPGGNGTSFVDSTGAEYTTYCGIDGQPGSYDSTVTFTYRACIEACSKDSRCGAVGYIGDFCYFKPPPETFQAEPAVRLAIKVPAAVGSSSSLSEILGSSTSTSALETSSSSALEVTTTTTTTTGTSDSSTSALEAITTTTTTTTSSSEPPTTTTTTTTTTSSSELPTTTTTTTSSSEFDTTTTTTTTTTTSSSSSSSAALPAATCLGAVDQSTYVAGDESDFLTLCGVDFGGNDLVGANPQPFATFNECADYCASQGTACAGSIYTAFGGATAVCYLKRRMIESGGGPPDYPLVAAVRRGGPGGANARRQVITNGDFSADSLTPWTTRNTQTGTGYTLDNGAAAVRIELAGRAAAAGAPVEDSSNLNQDIAQRVVGTPPYYLTFDVTVEPVESEATIDTRCQLVFQSGLGDQFTNQAYGVASTRTVHVSGPIERGGLVNLVTTATCQGSNDVIVRLDNIQFYVFLASESTDVCANNRRPLQNSNFDGGPAPWVAEPQNSVTYDFGSSNALVRFAPSRGVADDPAIIRQAISVARDTPYTLTASLFFDVASPARCSVGFNTDIEGIYFTGQIGVSGEEPISVSGLFETDVTSFYLSLDCFPGGASNIRVRDVVLNLSPGPECPNAAIPTPSATAFATTSATASPSASFVARATCPDGDKQQYQTGDGSQFTIACNQPYERNDIAEVSAADLSSCIDLCAARDDGCLGVSFFEGQGNCVLRYRMIPGPFEGITVLSAVRSSGPSTAQAPSSLLANGEFSSDISGWQSSGSNFQWDQGTARVVLPVSGAPDSGGSRYEGSATLSQALSGASAGQAYFLTAYFRRLADTNECVLSMRTDNEILGTYNYGRDAINRPVSVSGVFVSTPRRLDIYVNCFSYQTSGRVDSTISIDDVRLDVHSGSKFIPPAMVQALVNNDFANSFSPWRSTATTPDLHTFSNNNGRATILFTQLSQDAATAWFVQDSSPAAQTGQNARLQADVFINIPSPGNACTVYLRSGDTIQWDIENQGNSKFYQVDITFQWPAGGAQLLMSADCTGSGQRTSVAFDNVYLSLESTVSSSEPSQGQQPPAGTRDPSSDLLTNGDFQGSSIAPWQATNPDNVAIANGRAVLTFGTTTGRFSGDSSLTQQFGQTIPNGQRVRLQSEVYISAPGSTHYCSAYIRTGYEVLWYTETMSSTQQYFVDLFANLKVDDWNVLSLYGYCEGTDGPANVSFDNVYLSVQQSNTDPTDPSPAPPAVARRAVCPEDNAQIYTNDRGGQWLINCQQDFRGYDTSRPPFASPDLRSCIDACHNYGNGCQGVTFGMQAEGDSICYMKYHMMTGYDVPQNTALNQVNSATWQNAPPVLGDCPADNEKVYRSPTADKRWRLACNTDYRGGDIREVRPVNTLRDCIETCRTTAQCLGATFAFYQTGAPGCYLKFSIGQPFTGPPPASDGRGIVTVDSIAIIRANN